MGHTKEVYDAMTRGNKVVRAVARAGLGLLAALTAACGTVNSHLTPSASVSTLMAGWEYHFKLDWAVEPEPGDTRRIRGSIHNQHGEYAEPVRVLVQAFDASGVVIGQRITWIPGGVGGFGRAYFDIAHLPPVDTYRVTVWDYTFMQSDSDRR
ncbi:MAG: hypothetical protein HY511_06265 [Actinobacteria bacterium]|nr:hypothetical protein [Actinomycetota bacterium]